MQRSENGTPGALSEQPPQPGPLPMRTCTPKTKFAFPGVTDPHQMRNAKARVARRMRRVLTSAPKPRKVEKKAANVIQGQFMLRMRAAGG